jgi:2-methylcitrate dehydratase PrpD
MGDTIPAWLDAWSRFAASARLEDIDAATRARAKLTLADTLGAIAAGQQEPEIAALATRLAAQGGSGATSAVIATPHRLPASAAAFLNGVAGTALELDEGNRFARGHPCIHVLPAAIVAAERAGATGGGFLLALCLGYELAARIGAAAELRAGFHPHGTWGVVGAALAVARLSGADAPAIARTVNVASALSLATSMRTALEGGTVRNAYAGVANQLGLMAWEMAAAGFEGERDGVATVFGRISGTAFRPEAMTEALGTRWEVARNYFKRHACCRYNHAALDALEDLVARHGRPDPDRIAAVQIETYGAAAELDARAPHNALAARFSLPWAAASFLLRGVADVPAFRTEALSDASTRALAARVEVAEDPAMTARLPAQRPARVQVTLADGAVLESVRASNRGDADDPYPEAAIKAKFLDLATPAFGAARAAELLAETAGIERIADFSRFSARLSVGEAQ